MTVFRADVSSESLAGLMHFPLPPPSTLRRVVKLATCLLDNPFSFEPYDSVHYTQTTGTYE